MSIIQVTNHGPLIVSTNFWDSDIAAAGKFYCSINAGAIRVLLPRSRFAELNEMRSAKYCVLSRGPWPEQQQPDAVEILFEDESDSPYVLTLTPESFDMLPGEPEPGREWTLAVWTQTQGRPHKGLERICHWRRVPKIPCLKPWEAA